MGCKNGHKFLLTTWLCISSQQEVKPVSLPLESGLALVTYLGQLWCKQRFGDSLCIRTFVSHCAEEPWPPGEEAWASLLEDERPRGAEVNHPGWTHPSDQTACPLQDTQGKPRRLHPAPARLTQLIRIAQMIHRIVRNNKCGFKPKSVGVFMQEKLTDTHSKGDKPMRQASLPSKS